MESFAGKEFDVSYLIIALLGIAVTQPALVDQAGDDSWTAPGYRE